MNKIYKVIWSKTRNCYVAVSEIAKRNGKSCTSVNCGGKANRRCVALSLALALCVTGGAVFTMPQMAMAAVITITSGSVTIADDAHAADDYYLNGSNITFTVNAGGVVNSISGNSDAAVSGNTVTINGGTVNHAYTDWTEPSSGSGNWVGKPNLTGGFSTSGAVTGNQVSITNATLSGIYPTAYGGYSQTGNVSKNSVTFESGNNQELYINGGFSATGVAGGDTAADGNIVTIKSGTVNFVAGGYSERGSAKNNQVSVSGGTVNAEVYGGYVGGGTGEATDNKVDISGGTVGSSVYGGFSQIGTTEGNNVNVTGGHIAGAVYGGKIYGDSSNNTGAVIKNIVSVSGSGTQIDGEIQGGNSTYGKVEGNKVIISNGKLSNVVGGASSSDVVNNEVTITGGNMNNIYGGYIGSGTGKAEGNKVYISQSSTEVLTTINGFVYGGNSYNGNASLNEVTFTGGSVAKGIYGGHIGNNDSNGVVSGNKVTLDGSDAVVIQESYSNGVCGGYNWGSGAATGNQVEIKNGATVNNTVYGGYTYSGAAGGTTKEEGNMVIISSGTVTGTVYGGYVNGGTGTAGYNSVEITGGNLNNAYGGYINSGTGKAEGNKVSISGTETTTSIFGTVYGGRASGGNATSNRVDISGGTVGSSVKGGYSYTGTAEGNTVNVTGGHIRSDVYGAETSGDSTNNNGAVIKNIVSVSGSGTQIDGTIYGGNSIWGKVDGNKVTISNGKLRNVLGGKSTYGDVVNNEVTVSGSPDFTSGGRLGIYGGSSAYGAAKNNTVNILSSIAVGFLTGGQSMSGNSADVSGNTLNVAAKNVTSGSVSGFQNMNFYLPANIAKDDTMLTVNSGNATDVTGVTFGVAALSGVNLQKGDTVNLLVNSNGLTMDDTLKTTDSATLAKASFLSANSLTTDNKYELSISKKGEDTIIATVDNVTEQSADTGGGTSGDTSAVEEIKKSPVETRMGVVTMVNAGADLLAGQGMSNAAEAAAAERSGGDGVATARAGGFAPFAAVGLGNLRAKSGSHVDTKSIGLSLGFAREIENKSGKLLVGPVVEYGHGKYDSYQDNGITADGKSSYWGIGVIAKQTNHNGFYYEGSLRAGRTKSDYGSDSARPGNHVSYDSSATYWAAHLGAGKLFDIGHDNTLDVYGKYFYSHTGSDSTTIHIGAASEGVDFSAVNSHRLRIGTRLTHALDAKNKIYGGLAWQYEFNGDARAVYSVSGEAPSPSVKGSSGMLELGWQVKPGKSPMTIDLGVTGWVGKQRGITANVQANWTF